MTGGGRQAVGRSGARADNPVNFLFGVDKRSRHGFIMSRTAVLRPTPARYRSSRHAAWMMASPPLTSKRDCKSFAAKATARPATSGRPSPTKTVQHRGRPGGRGGTGRRGKNGRIIRVLEVVVRRRSRRSRVRRLHVDRDVARGRGVRADDELGALRRRRRAELGEQRWIDEQRMAVPRLTSGAQWARACGGSTRRRAHGRRRDVAGRVSPAGTRVRRYVSPRRITPARSRAPA